MVRTVCLVLGMAVLALLLWYLRPSEILDLLRRIGWYSIPILSVYAAYHATRALALHSCVLRPGVLGYRACHCRVYRPNNVYTGLVAVGGRVPTTTWRCALRARRR